MDILKAATEWAKAELVSTPFFMLFGVFFLVASIGFWQLGKSDIARAYIIPTMIAGALLLTIGLGLFFTNKSRLAAFESDYKKDSIAFVESEITRAEGTLKEYQKVVFRVIPLLIILFALGVLFFNSPGWRASLITAMAMLVVILLIDGTAHARIDSYHKQLLSAEVKEK